jgi:hypothetical protein
MHYMRNYRHGDPLVIRRKKQDHVVLSESLVFELPEREGTWPPS